MRGLELERIAERYPSFRSGTMSTEELEELAEAEVIGQGYARLEIVQCPWPMKGTVQVMRGELVVIYIDSRMPAEGRRAILAHEVGHIVAGHIADGATCYWSAGADEARCGAAEAFRKAATGGSYPSRVG